MEGKKRYYFFGDLTQMQEAVRVAKEYGFEPQKSENFRWYMEDEKQYEVIVNKLIQDRIAGYWHYPEFWKK